MNNVNPLLKRIDKMLTHIELLQDDMSVEDICEQVSAWCKEGIARKFEIHWTPGLTSEGKSLLCKEVDQDIASRKTPAEQRAEQRYYTKYPCQGSRERLLQRITSMRASNEGPAA